MVNGYSIYSTVPILEVRHLSKNFGEHEVLRDIDFRVSYGEVVSIIGPSGGGKSTLLRCMNGLETPNSGEVLHNGHNIFNKGRGRNEYRAKVGMVFQNFTLFENMTVLENCMIGIFNLFKTDREEASKLAMKALDMVGMTSYINIRPNLLSEGQKQRIAIARALIMEPEVLLLDDPTGGLDSFMIGEVLEVINNLANYGMAIVLVTNEIDFARDISSHVVFMDGGVIVEEGSPEVIFNKPKNRSMGYFFTDIDIVRHNNIFINY